MISRVEPMLVPVNDGSVFQYQKKLSFFALPFLHLGQKKERISFFYLELVFT